MWHWRQSSSTMWKYPRLTASEKMLPGPKTCAMSVMAARRTNSASSSSRRWIICMPSDLAECLESTSADVSESVRASTRVCISGMLGPKMTKLP